MTQEANNSTVRVEIFGKAFDLRGTEPDHALELARYVDSKIRAATDRNPHKADSGGCSGCTQAAILAALTIASEYHLLQHELELLKQELDGDEAEASGEEETPEEDPPSPKPLTEEARHRIRARRTPHFTRRAYDRRLLAIANGEVVLTKKQHQALLAFGRSKGWNRCPPAKR